ncbi:MAG: DUF3179 domain-containing (seleno)protein [bacterium]
MKSAKEKSPSSPGRLLTFASGGWVILLALGLVIAAASWRILDMVRSRDSHAIGDGETIESYQFQLTPCLVSRETLAPTHLAKDGLAALVNPHTITASQSNEEAKDRRTRFLVSSDRVVGVAMNGQARAYPILMLNWHEVVNDTVGGVPIAVTYDPLCDSVVVFDRRVGGETLEFGVSGLVSNSNFLMFDRRSEAKGESLWSQLERRAVAGDAAAAGLKLEILPCCFMSWEDWQRFHPDTTVLTPDPVRKQRYLQRPYAPYIGNDELRFPVNRAAPLTERTPFRKTEMLALKVDDRFHVYSFPEISERAGERGWFEETIQTRKFRIHYRRRPETAWVEAGDGGQPVPTVYSFWFAWYATHPDDPQRFD